MVKDTTFWDLCTAWDGFSIVLNENRPNQEIEITTRLNKKSESKTVSKYSSMKLLPMFGVF